MRGKLLGHLVQPAEFTKLKLSPASSPWGDGLLKAGLRLEPRTSASGLGCISSGQWTHTWGGRVRPESLPSPHPTQPDKGSQVGWPPECIPTVGKFNKMERNVLCVCGGKEFRNMPFGVC